MKKSIRIFTAAVLMSGIQGTWAADDKVDKPAMGQGSMQGGEMKGMNMDKEHMQQMHERMDEMHKSMDMGKGDTTCAMKSDGKCDAKDMKSGNKITPDKAKAPANADEHSEHH